MFVIMIFFLHISVNVLCAGGASLLWAMCVSKYTTVGFMEALKPFIGLFQKWSSIKLCSGPWSWSGEFLCVIEFLCRCWPVITWNHITVGWEADQEEKCGEKTFECVRKALRLSQSGQWRHDKSVQNFNCFHTHKAELNWAIWGCLEMFVTVITALH